MDDSNIGYAASVFAFSFASAACSTTSSISAPHEVSREIDSPPPCRVTGPPAVLARHVFVPRGVEVQERGARFQLRFATAKSQCLSVEWPSTKESPQGAVCPDASKTVTASAVSGDETTSASESITGNADRVGLGDGTYDAPYANFGFVSSGRQTALVHSFRTPHAGAGGSQTSPDLVRIGGERFLRFWVEGGVERHQLRAQSVASWGDPIGPALDLSTFDVSVIGRARAAIAPNGEGVVAYIASLGEEFDVFGTPIACSTR